MGKPVDALVVGGALGYIRANVAPEVVLSKLEVEKLNPNPEFDLFLYLRVAGGGKMEQAVCDLCQAQWAAFKEHLRGYRFAEPKARRGVALFFLEPVAEGLVEEAWGRSPSEGFALHNLAVTMEWNSVRFLRTAPVAAE